MNHLAKSSLALLLLALVASILSPQPVSAESGGGAHVGGGGGAWTCREQDGSLRWIRLLDLDEGRREFFADEPVTIPLGNEAQYAKTTAEQWLKRAEQRLFQASPGFFSQYSFEKTQVLKAFKEVKDSEFSSTEDFYFRSKPQADPFCVGGTISAKPEQLAIFNETVGLLEINALLWNSPKLLPIDRAALYMHETIYYMLRQHANHTDSVKTRFLVAHLFSDMPVKDLALLFTDETLKPEGVWSPRLGMYLRLKKESKAWAPVVIKTFDESTGILTLNQENSYSGKVMQRHQFRCRKVTTAKAQVDKPEQYKYVCTMTWASSWWTRHRGVENHELQISKNSITWLNRQNSGHVSQVTYLYNGKNQLQPFSD